MSDLAAEGDRLRPSYFWCTLHDEVHRFSNYAFADKQIHEVTTLEGCTMVGPYFTSAEAVEWGGRHD